MKRIATLLIASGLLALSVAPTHAAVLQKNDGSIAKTAKSIDIMRRVIVKSINLEIKEYIEADTKPSDVTFTGRNRLSTVASGGFAYVSGTGVFSSFASSARGHYVPGHGAIFSLELAVPHTQADAADEPAPKEKADDLWNEAAREAAGNHTGVVAAAAFGSAKRSRKVYVADEQAIEHVIDAVVEVVGRHGTKIEGLDTGDSIIVALDVTGGAISVDESDTAGEALIYSLYSGTGSNMDEQHIVIELNLEDVKRYAGQRMDLDGLRERAKVTRY